MDKPMRVNAALSEWEEMMVADLCQQYSLPDEAVLNIGITFLMNELSGSMNGKPSLLNSIHSAGLNNDITLPDIVEEDSINGREN